MNTKKLQSFGQVALLSNDERSRDRNFNLGGRSFYFFDFDDNIVHLQTKIRIFHKNTHELREVSTSDFPLVYPKLGKAGSEWELFEILEGDPVHGSYRNFRELPPDALEGQEQPLIRDMLEAIENPFRDWRGPSWNFFAHAVNNNRPVSVITARGHHPFTIRRAVDFLVHSGDLTTDPNYLSVYPVSHPLVRHQLGDLELKLSTAELKKRAIIAAVQDAYACYGRNPHHRFGMSDDDPANVDLIIEAMRELKVAFPENAFFVFNTHGGKMEKIEIFE